MNKKLKTPKDVIEHIQQSLSGYIIKRHLNSNQFIVHAHDEIGPSIRVVPKPLFKKLLKKKYIAFESVGVQNESSIYKTTKKGEKLVDKTPSTQQIQPITSNRWIAPDSNYNDYSEYYHGFSNQSNNIRYTINTRISTEDEF